MRTFGWTKPIRGTNGGIIGTMEAPVKVRSIEELGHLHGIDHAKRLVLTCHREDLIGLRPERTSREVKISVFDVYLYALRCQARLVQLEEARIKKEKKAVRLAAKRQDRAERKLFGKGKR